MTPDELWLWLGRASALLGVALLGLIAVPAIASPAYLRRHFFFLFYAATVCAYLQVAPTLAQLGEPPAAVFVYRLAPIQELRPQYGWMQLTTLATFFLPLLIAYFATQSAAPADDRLRAHGARARWLAIGSSLFALAFLGTLVRHRLWNVRLGDALTDRLLEMPAIEFALFRLFQECGLFVIGVLLFAWRLSRGATRTWCLTALLLTVAIYGGFNLLNSRWFVISLIVCVVGWNLAAAPVPTWRVHAARLATIAGVGLLGLYLVLVVVNVRRDDGAVTVASLLPQSGVFGDTQGVNRLDCIDLMARLKDPIDERGPAYFRSWGQVTWLVWRFVDPAGFDAYRLSRLTTAKSYLMREYLRVEAVDYFSCMATDLYGNFKVAGLLAGALLVALALSRSSATLCAPASGAGLLVAIFVLTQVVIFDQEAVFTLFGWVRKIPVLGLLLLLRPFVRADTLPAVPARGAPAPTAG